MSSTSKSTAGKAIVRVVFRYAIYCDSVIVFAHRWKRAMISLGTVLDPH